MTFHASGEFELEQDDAHRCRRAAGEADEVVDGDRRRPEQRYNTRALVVRGGVCAVCR